jgi:YD repeat-containing protein
LEQENFKDSLWNVATYNEHGQITSITTGINYETIYKDGKLITIGSDIAAELGEKTTTYIYDEKGYLIEIDNSDDTGSYLTYDNGLLTKIHGTQTAYIVGTGSTKDNFGISIEYDEDGRITLIDPQNSDRWEFSY